MQSGITREDVIIITKSLIHMIVRHDKLMVDSLEKIESAHNIKQGFYLEVLNDVDKLDSLGLIELGILLENLLIQSYRLELGIADMSKEKEQVAIRLAKEELLQYFTAVELTDFKVYKKPIEVVQGVRTFKPSIKIDDNVYIVKMSYKELAQSYDIGDYTWDENAQREGVDKTYLDKTYVVPKVYPKNVKAIEQKVSKGVLLPTEIALNIIPESTEDGVGLYYDPETFTLTLADEFRGQIIDGMHRINGIHKAWLKDNTIEGSMQIRLSNYTTEQAANFLVENAEAIPIDKSKIESMNKSRTFNRVVDNIKFNSYMLGKITNKSNPIKSKGEVYTYKSVSDAFYDIFEKYGQYKPTIVQGKFNEFVNVLFDLFESELENRNSILFDDSTIYYLVYLFKLLTDEAIDYSELDKIINPNDWVEKSEIMKRYNLKSKNNRTTSKGKLNGKQMIDELVINYLNQKGVKSNG